MGKSAQTSFPIKYEDFQAFKTGLLYNKLITKQNVKIIFSHLKNLSFNTKSSILFIFI